MKKDYIPRVLDTLAGTILFVAAAVILVVIFAVLTITVGWLVIPVLLIVGAVLWLARRGIL